MLQACLQASTELEVLLALHPALEGSAAGSILPILSPAAIASLVPVLHTAYTSRTVATCLTSCGESDPDSSSSLSCCCTSRAKELTFWRMLPMLELIRFHMLAAA